MAALTTNNIANAGTAPSFGNSSASDTAEIGNGLNTFVVYRNTGGSASVVTITVLGNTSYGQPNPQPAVTVPATTGEKWIPMRKEYDPGDGSGRATLSATNSGATLQVAVVRMG
ncbi:hypothetical protein [Streptomyces sp. OK228]|uniref:hypothetical protein n=1 Tax=Streptomyces sp. OK228 TaxID=1882786 RepID=UPI000BD7A008|nr:hypothetical protein [Streptomyces sp. OK228]SOE25610.1 hypothetical protein SAMN05442782_2352 [Streptomyces sp. OK228]